MPKKQGGSFPPLSNLSCTGESTMKKKYRVVIEFEIEADEADYLEENIDSILTGQGMDFEIVSSEEMPPQPEPKYYFIRDNMGDFEIGTAKNEDEARRIAEEYMVNEHGTDEFFVGGFDYFHPLSPDSRPVVSIVYD